MQRFLDDAALLDGCEIVAGRPEAGGVFFVEVDDAGFEGLEGDLTFAEIFISQALKIGATHVDRQILAPIFVVELEFDEPTLFKRLYLISARPERRLESGRIEIPPLPPCRRKYRHARYNEMSVARALLDETHLDDILAFGLHAFDFGQQPREGRMRLFLQGGQREDYVFGAQRRPVRKTRLRTKQETICQLVRRKADGVSEQSIDRVGLVFVAAHQRIVGRQHARRAVALLRKDIERVEGLKILIARRRAHEQSQQAALGRVGIDIGQRLEIRRQRQIPESREPVRLDLVLGPRKRPTDAQRCGEACRCAFQRRSS